VSERKAMTCENCGHDVFMEITSTESRVCGKFELREDAIVLLEQHEEVPEFDRRETALILRRVRCGKPAYERLSPIGDDAPGFRRRPQRWIDGIEFVRSLGFDEVADEIEEERRRRLERAAQLVAEGGPDIISPEQLAELRQVSVEPERKCLDTGAHARIRAVLMEDPEYREEYERSMREIREQQERGE
jgi:hypothetical protein